MTGTANKTERTPPAGTDTAAAPRLLYTENAAARLLSISPRSLQKLRKAKKVKFVRIGVDGVRYSAKALEEWIETSLQLDDTEGELNGHADHR